MLHATEMECLSVTVRLGVGQVTILLFPACGKNRVRLYRSGSVTLLLFVAFFPSSVSYIVPFSHVISSF